MRIIKIILYLSFLLLTGIIGSVGIYEMIYRQGGNTGIMWHDPNIRFDPELGWAPISNRYIKDYGGVTANSLGFRSDELKEGKSIIVIGDSVAWGFGVKNAETITSRLESDVQSSGYQVSNLAVSGYSIDQYYLRLRQNIGLFKDLKYVILIIYAGNDYWETITDVASNRRKPLFILENDALTLSNVPISKFDRRNFVAQSFLLMNFSNKYRQVKDAINNWAGQKKLPAEEGKLVISKLLGEIQQLANNHGATLAVFVSPSKVDFKEKSKSLSWFQNFFKNSSYLYFDLFDSLQADSGELDTIYRPDDNAHFSPYGCNLIAGIISKDLGL